MKDTIDHQKERVLLVIVGFKQEEGWPLEDISREMEQLVTACGGEVIERVLCRPDRPTAATLIPSGKVKDIAEMCLAHPVDTVIFSYDLKGSQQRNLENEIKAKTIDRTQLILDIFAQHATSSEGKTQVELAQLQYLLPRLVGKGIELSRLGGGIGTLGPGETKLEVDRRRISQRIDKLRRDLQKTSASRKVKRKKRQDRQIPTISLVGYTNAGKSTLLNALTKASQKTVNGLFTTLDSLSRQYVLPNHQTVVFSDTVGFMHDLPHHLIESFKATLEEVQEADILLHVVDVSHPRFRNLHDAVLDVLGELNVLDKPRITVLNKVDRLTDRQGLETLMAGWQPSVCVSARTGENLEDLVEVVTSLLQSRFVDIDTLIPLDHMDFVSLVHREGKVHSIEYLSDGVHIRASVPAAVAARLRG